MTSSSCESSKLINDHDDGWDYFWDGINYDDKDLLQLLVQLLVHLAHLHHCAGVPGQGLSSQ